MRALIQRVTKASVTVDHKIIGAIETGIVIFVGISKNDNSKHALYLAEKCVHLRIFEDEKSYFNHSLLDVKGNALVISQFTLYGDTRRGRRPGFDEAARPELAQPLYNTFVNEIKKYPIVIAEGMFGANMLVEIHNDGPVTFIVESKAKQS